jgi:hypothetical protein
MSKPSRTNDAGTIRQDILADVISGGFHTELVHNNSEYPLRWAFRISCGSGQRLLLGGFRAERPRFVKIVGFGIVCGRPNA